MGKERRAVVRENSLSIVLFLLFFLFLAGMSVTGWIEENKQLAAHHQAAHAFGGMTAYNQEAAQHGEVQISIVEYVTSARFWYESFQNWQSEFLAVGTLLVLSVFLRERGSPESKPVGQPNAKTGHG